MKKTTTIITAMFITAATFTACKNTEKEPADSEQETIKNEISGVNAQVIKYANELNVDGELKSYSTDFKGVNTDGSAADYQTLGSGQKDFFKTVTTIHFAKVKEDFKFLSKTFVLCTWTGTLEVTSKTGEQQKFAPHTASLLYQKINNEWKIVYEHDSEAPVKAEVKK